MPSCGRHWSVRTCRFEIQLVSLSKCRSSIIAAVPFGGSVWTGGSRPGDTHTSTAAPARTYAHVHTHILVCAVAHAHPLQHTTMHACSRHTVSRSHPSPRSTTIPSHHSSTHSCKPNRRNVTSRGFQTGADCLTTGTHLSQGTYVQPTYLVRYFRAATSRSHALPCDLYVTTS